MGLFSKKVIVVSSTVYNLAGDIKKRPNYLKSSIVSDMISKGADKFNFYDMFTDNYMKGQGLRLRNYYKWSLKNLVPYTGQVNAKFNTIGKIDTSLLINNLPIENKKNLVLNSYVIESADIDYWVEQWLLENYPSEILKDNYTYTFENNLVTITLSDNTVHNFIPRGYNESKSYLYISYSITDPETKKYITHIYIYPEGTGNKELDELFVKSSMEGSFYSFIPFRLNNKFISEDYLPDVYKISKKSFKKAFNSSYDKTLEQISENKKIKDLNYIYVIFGASLNADDTNACDYIYRFFNNILVSQNISNSTSLDDWKNSLSEANEKNKALIEWIDAQGDVNNPLYGTDIPEGGVNTQLPKQTITIQSSDNKVMNYDIRISWNAISKVQGTGIKKEGKKVNECWIELNDSVEYSYVAINGLSYKKFNDSINHITIYRQDNKKSWSGISIFGLKHNNYIYKGRSVEIDAKEAMLDKEESGFIIPLQYDIFKKINLIKGTQFSLCNSYLLFNCYKVYKTKWYQSGFFKIFAIFTIVVISSFTFGLGATFFPAIGGLFGITGIAATIVGIAVTLVAAMVIMKGITLATTAMFGKMAGSIITSLIIAVAAYFIGTGDLSSFQLMPFLNSATQVTNNITNLVIENQIDSVMKKTENMINYFNEKQSDLNEMFKNNIGNGSVDLSQSILNLSLQTQLNLLNSPDIFLDRTLMTASDMFDRMYDNIENFADNSLMLYGES